MKNYGETEGKKDLKEIENYNLELIIKRWAPKQFAINLNGSYVVSGLFNSVSKLFLSLSISFLNQSYPIPINSTVISLPLNSIDRNETAARKIKKFSLTAWA